MRVWWIVIGLLGACGNDKAVGEDEGDAGSCAARPDPHCDHPIDRLLVPKLRGLGLEPRDASAQEVCRRMAIDLLGRAPNDAERAVCVGQSFAEMADTFMASPEFVRTQRRAWSELFHYQALTVWNDDQVDLDALVGQLYRDEVTYDAFVRRAVVHSGFVSLNRGDMWTQAVFTTFLGRPARNDELAAARPLLAPFVERTFSSGSVFWSWYRWAKGNGWTEQDATNLGVQQSYNGPKVEVVSNLCRCTPGLLNAGCFSDVFGPLVQLVPICALPATPSDPANEFRREARTPSSDDLCGDGVTRRIECSDRRLVAEPRYTFSPIVVAPEMTAAMRAEWDKIGAALVGRPDLWEAAADREIKKLLGWWHATFKHPESDLPEVRALLATKMKEGLSPREVIKLIVTSQLYVQPRALGAEVDAATLPPWAAGPSKLLAGESWWASAATVVGETAGRCDFRWGQSNTYEPRWADVGQVETTVGSLDGRYPAPAPEWGRAVHAIQRLGGCTGDARRVDLSNVGLAYAQAAIAREVCALAASVTPPGWSGDLRDAATFLVRRVWARDPLDGEVETMAQEMAACVAAGANGCATPEIAARWLCTRLIDSAEFSTY